MFYKLIWFLSPFVSVILVFVKNSIILLLVLLVCLFETVQSQVSEIGSSKFTITKNANSYVVPYYSNHDLNTASNGFTSAVVVIHGTNRNAYSYYPNMLNAYNNSIADQSSTIIIAPQFLTETDIDTHAASSDHLYWSSGGWKSGALSKDYSTNPRADRMPSFEVVDSMLVHLARQYPNLKSIVVTGHSAGGQFTNRYAATSPIVSVLNNQYQIGVKFIVANPSSYVYLDEKRLVEDSQYQFEVPSTSCSDYNDWKYGLDGVYTYQERIGKDSIIKMYENQEVIYLLGQFDNDENSSSLDVSCEAMLQGNHRLERGLVYYEYLKDFYGEGVSTNHSVQQVPGVGHSNFSMYNSEEGKYHLFENMPLYCNQTIVNNIDRAICFGDTYSFGNRILTITGEYRDTVITDNGCDSVVILSLEVYPRNEVNDTLVFEVNDTSFYNVQNGIYKVGSDTLQSVSSCDSIYNLYHLFEFKYLDSLLITVVDSNVIDVFDTTFISYIDTLEYSIYDTLVHVVNDTNYIDLFDTTFITHIDTLEYSIFDTLIHMVNDTNYINLIDTTFISHIDTVEYSIYDTLVHVVNDTNYIDLFDTTLITHVDTIEYIVYDTLFSSLTDTSFINIYDTISIAQIDTIEFIYYDTVQVSVADTLIISRASSIDDQEILFKVYPNPSSSYLYVDFLIALEETNFNLKLYSLSGQLIEQFANQQAQIVIDISNYSSGLYLLELESDAFLFCGPT